MSTFTPTPSNAYPGYAPSPFTAFTNLPYGSDLAALVNAGGTVGTESALLKKVIEHEIYYTAPLQYAALLDIVSKGIKDVEGDEYEFLTYGFGRTPLTVYSWTYGTGTILLTGTLTSVPVAKGDTIFNVAGTTTFMVESVTYSGNANSCAVVVKAEKNVSLTAGDFSTGDILAMNGTTLFDGGDAFYHYDRVETVTNWNTIREYNRNQFYTINDWNKKMRAGNTNFLEVDKANTRQQLLTDMMSDYFNGYKKVFNVAAVNGNKTFNATTFEGIYPRMVNAGAPIVPSTLSGLISTFKSLAFKTNKKEVGGMRRVYGTPEMLHNLSVLFKDGKVRYSPSDSRNSIDLSEYEFGGMRFLPIPVQLFQENSVFPVDWAKKILVVDTDSIDIVKLAWKKASDSFFINDFTKGQNTNQYMQWVTTACLGMMFKNPAGGFVINMS